MRDELASKTAEMTSSHGHHALASLVQTPRIIRLFPNGTDPIPPAIRHHQHQHDHGQPMASHYVVDDEHALLVDVDNKRNATKSSVFWSAMNELFNLSSSAMASVTADDGRSSVVVTSNNTTAGYWDGNKANAVTDWGQIVTVAILAFITLATIVGNVLVILSVFTYKPLRMVQNFFIVSLAAADLTVALLVLPLNMAYLILEKWIFGVYVCEMWLTCDVLCCTASM